MADNNRCHGRCHVSENREYINPCSHFEDSIVTSSSVMSISVYRSSEQPFSRVFTKISIGSISNGECERRTAWIKFQILS